MKPFKITYSFIPTLFLGSLHSGCALFKATPNIEIIYPPSISNDLKSIPSLEKSNDFQRLNEADSISEVLEIGRNDPFLPPQLDSNQIKAPEGLMLHGIIEANNKLIALISNNIFTGSVEVGDTGGVNTDLIPKGWSVDSILLDKNKLNLVYKDKLITIELEDI